MPRTPPVPRPAPCPRPTVTCSRAAASRRPRSAGTAAPPPAPLAPARPALGTPGERSPEPPLASAAPAGGRREAGAQRREAGRARGRPNPSLTAALGAAMTARAGRAVAAAPPPPCPPSNRRRRRSPVAPAPSARAGQGRLWDRGMNAGRARSPPAPLRRSLPPVRTGERRKPKVHGLGQGPGEITNRLPSPAKQAELGDIN